MLKIRLFLMSILVCQLAIAQQSNHWVVQGYTEYRNPQFDTSVGFKTYYDVDLNSPKFKVSKIQSRRILNDTNIHNPQSKISPGYQTISNSKGSLLGFTFNNILHNKNGDSIDYISQYGGIYGIVCSTGNTDTFILYYIQSKTEFDAYSFENRFNRNHGLPFEVYKPDSFFLMESTYVGSTRLSKKIINGFKQFDSPSSLQSNLSLFTDQKKEKRIQFVWNQNIYDVNISKNYQTTSRQIIRANIQDRYYPVWLDVEYGQYTANRLVTSPSGRWSVLTWTIAIKENRVVYKYSKSKVFLIDNENLTNTKEIFQDSAIYITDKFTFWKNPVFTKEDSVFLIQKIVTNKGEANYISEKSIIEIKIANSIWNYRSFNIDIDKSIYANPDVYYKSMTSLKDFTLAPNGNIFVFVTETVFSGNQIDPDSRKFYIAKLNKDNGNYGIVNPVIIFEGFTKYRYYDYDIYDQVFFPQTPGAYHKIEFKANSLCYNFLEEVVNLSDTSWFCQFEWFWGDGNSSKTDKLNLKTTHRYKYPGKFEVLLKATTPDGGWVWYSDSIEVLPEPIAKYHTKNTVGCQWIAVEFSDSSILEKKSHTWKWDFGDGNDTTLTSPGNIMPKNKSIKHTYTTSGKFNVQLQVSDGRCTDTFNAIQNISILPAPRPGIAIDKTSGCTPLEVQFGRTYSDPTDSTIYRFKPVIVPTNHFDQAINKARLTQSGKYLLLQKLYGPSGCITKDSIALNITQGIEDGLKPFMKRSTVVNNANILTEWQTVPAAKNYQLYRNGMPLAVVNDTFYLDALSQEIDQSYRYQIQPIDSCDKTVAQRSNVGKTIFLKVVEQAQVSVNEFPSALLTWTPYEDWSLSGGVQNYVCVGNLDKETTNWQLLTNQVDTQFNDKQFIERSKFEKCYRIQARSADGRFVTESNTACLGYTATLFAPNAFTPNGDGLNDAFEIFNYGFDRFTLSIYDRWGQKIYEASSSEAIWKPASDIPAGVYVYQVKAYKQDKEYGFSSTVTLLR